MPGYSCSVKERMLYSSCKNHLVDWVESVLDLPIEKKVKANRIQSLNVQSSSRDDLVGHQMNPDNSLVIFFRK